MKRLLILVIVCVISIGLSGISLAQEKIIIAGTGDSQTMLRILATIFEKKSPGNTIEVTESIGSSGGIKAAAEGKCNLGRIARPVKDKEKIYKLNYKVFAYSPVVFVANHNVSWIDNLTTQQILDIYSGKITLWSDLGRGNGNIYVANREDGDSSREVLSANIPGWKDIIKFAGNTVYSTPETVEIIVKHKNTMGYLPLSEVKGTDLVIIKIDGVYPSIENVQNGKYKLLTPFGIVWKGELSGLAKSFFDFLFSSEAQNIIIENGGIPPR